MSNFDLIDRVMDSLGAMFPSWTNNSRDKSVRYVWARAMNRAGLTLEDIKRGIEKAEREVSTFPPSCGQFIDWCGHESSISLPGRNQAYQEACLHQKGHDWSCPAVYHAASRTGLFDLKQQPESKTRPLFFEHYADVCAEVKQGARLELPKPVEPPRIEAREPTKEDREHARRQIKAMMEGLGQ